MWPALSKDPKDLVVRMRVPPASLSQSQGWSPLPSLWQLGSPFLNHRKTPWQSLLHATSPHCWLIKVLLLKMSSFCGITIFFFKYKHLLSETRDHHLCFRWKSMCREVGGRPGPAWKPSSLLHLGPARATCVYRWLTYLVMSWVSTVTQVGAHQISDPWKFCWKAFITEAQYLLF